MIYIKVPMIKGRNGKILIVSNNNSGNVFDLLCIKLFLIVIIR